MGVVVVVVVVVVIVVIVVIVVVLVMVKRLVSVFALFSKDFFSFSFHFFFR